MQGGSTRRQHQRVEPRAVVGNANRQRIFTHPAFNLRGKRLTIDGTANAGPAQMPAATYFIASRLRLYCAGARFDVVIGHQGAVSAVHSSCAQTQYHKLFAHRQAVARQLPADARRTAQHAAVNVGRQGHQKVRVIVRHVFSLEALAIVFSDKTGIEITRHKLRVCQQRRLKRDVAADAANHKAIERLTHFGNRLKTVFTVDDELGNHRVVEHRNLAAVLHAGIDPHAVQLRGVGRKHGFFGRLKTHQAAGAGQKTAKRVFGIDAAFHRPAVTLHVLLLKRQLFTCRHANHQLHQVQPGNAFGHRVLHLKAGVHFQKVKALVFADYEFNRACALVVNSFGQLHGLLSHGLACGIADKR